MKFHLRALNVVWNLVLAGAVALISGQALAAHGVPLVTSKDRQTIPFDKRFAPGEIVVSFGDRRLYHIRERGTAISYPIAVPRSQSRWSGVERITMKRVNPPWMPTSEMRRENPHLPTYVPGGHPMNPLGVRGLYLGQTSYRIHGTDAPWTIGQDVSKGCIRMLNEHVIELYDRTPVGTKVTATWDRFSTPAPIATDSKGTETIFDLFRF